jgi:hypothetical protein
MVESSPGVSRHTNARMEELKLERQISPLRPVILGGMLGVPQGLTALRISFSKLATHEVYRR